MQFRKTHVNARRLRYIHRHLLRLCRNRERELTLKHSLQATYKFVHWDRIAGIERSCWKQAANVQIRGMMDQYDEQARQLIVTADLEVLGQGDAMYLMDMIAAALRAAVAAERSSILTEVRNRTEALTMGGGYEAGSYEALQKVDILASLQEWIEAR